MSASPQPVARHRADPDIFLHGIDTLFPAIRERAGVAGHDGMVSREVIGWLTGAGMFRAGQPRQ